MCLFFYQLTELEMGLDLHLVHLLGIGEHELQHQVGEAALKGHAALGLSTVAVDVGEDVLEFDGTVVHLTDIGISRVRFLS